MLNRKLMMGTTLMMAIGGQAKNECDVCKPGTSSSGPNDCVESNLLCSCTGSSFDPADLNCRPKCKNTADLLKCVAKKCDPCGSPGGWCENAVGLPVSKLRCLRRTDGNFVCADFGEEDDCPSTAPVTPAPKPPAPKTPAPNPPAPNPPAPKTPAPNPPAPKTPAPNPPAPNPPAPKTPAPNPPAPNPPAPNPPAPNPPSTKSPTNGASMINPIFMAIFMMAVYIGMN